MTARSGVEIDYCPKCRGVWLDRGELDKIIERAASESGPAPVQRVASAPAPTPSRDHDDRNWDRRQDSYSQKPRYEEKHYKKKRESFLGELFDF